MLFFMRSVIPSPCFFEYNRYDMALSATHIASSVLLFLFIIPSLKEQVNKNV